MENKTNEVNGKPQIVIRIDGDNQNICYMPDAPEKPITKAEARAIVGDKYEVTWIIQ